MESAGSSADLAGSDLAVSDLANSGDLGFSSLGLWAMASGAARSAARVQEQRCRIIAWEGLLGVLRRLEKYSGWCSRELVAIGAVLILSTAVLEMSTARWCWRLCRLFLTEDGLELGMGFEDVFRHGAQDIDAEVMVFRELESSGDQFEGEAAAAELLGDFGVPEGQPAVAVGFEFEIAGLAVLLDREAAAGDLGWVVHAVLRCLNHSGDWPGDFGPAGLLRLLGD